MRFTRSSRTAIGHTVALVAGLAAAAPAFAVDVTVSNVEVTQATQTPTNAIPLIATRSTAVRATLGVTDNGGAPLAGVTGRLHVFRDGVEVTPAAGLTPINAPFTAPVAPQRANEDDTLNFELIAPVLLTASTDVDFRVDITPVAGEANTANNSGAANDLDVLDATNPSLFFTRVDFTAAGLGLPALSSVASPRGDAMIRGIMPVKDGDADLYREGLFPTLTFNSDDNANGTIADADSDIDDLLNLLEACRQLIVSNGLGATNTTFLHGWLQGNPIQSNGWAGVGGRTSFGNTDFVRAQRTYAHELTHNLNFTHNSAFLDQVGWDVGARLPDNPATNGVAGRVKPTGLRDIMVAGLLTPQAWVDTTKYQAFMSNSAFGVAGPDSEGDAPKPSRRVAVIRGVFDRSGRRLVELLPVLRFPWRSQPTVLPRRGRFAVRITTTTGQRIVAPFDALLGDDRRRELPGAFAVQVPVSGQITSLRITDASGKRRFGALRASKAAPTIRILDPQRGDRLGRRTTVRWRARDTDSETSDLVYQVAWSPNGGEDFVPVAVDLRKPVVTFDSTRIPRSRGQGLLRVFASDGLNTSFADVTKLTTTKARFRTP